MGDLNGVLVVDKPQGPTSHDVVAEARRALSSRRIGHTGTLDPLATGVLPLVMGHATRLSQFLTGAPKGYEATIRLGVATDTYDAAGEPVRSCPDSEVLRLSDAAVSEVLDAFRGAIEQAPPPFSAKKIGGVRAYSLARRRLEVETVPVRVHVHELELVERRGCLLRLRVEASSGFYVRSLAHDLGQRLACGAHLAELRRYRSGGFTLSNALALEELRARRHDAARERLVPMECLLAEVPAFDLAESGARKAAHGNALGPADGRPRAGSIPPPGALTRLFSPQGRLVGLARTTTGGSLQPVVVLG